MWGKSIMETRFSIINKKKFNVPIDKTVKLDTNIELSKSQLLRDMLEVSQNTPFEEVDEGLLNTWQEVLFIVNSERLAYLVFNKKKKFYKEYLA